MEETISFTLIDSVFEDLPMSFFPIIHKVKKQLLIDYVLTSYGMDADGIRNFIS